MDCGLELFCTLDFQYNDFIANKTKRTDEYKQATVNTFFTLEKDTTLIVERLDKMVPAKQGTRIALDELCSWILYR